MDYSRTPKLRWGQRVVAGIDLFNDGTYPEREAEALLVERGAAGEVVQVGQHEESGVPVYMVEFPGAGVIGCLEEEIAPA